MSYITIADFIKSGRQSLAAKNYWSALSVALMLPSMCSRLAYSNESESKHYASRSFSMLKTGVTNSD